ncbi:MAG: hypothetical protein LBQ02_04070 [Candidatus Nomurabacteria bacterium]|jgi:hypothetical protein|nr:hypothetical protein [Candidatus Nomurabacteria bacterium]
MNNGGNDSFSIPNIDSSDKEATLPTVVKNIDVKNTTIPAVTTTGVHSNTPEVAKDGNLIEKEWVEHIDQIVRNTKDNPHQREEEIKNVQADYLRKRLNYQIGDSQK